MAIEVYSNGTKRPVREANYSPAFSAEIINGRPRPELAH
jgi:hypothetical protein